MSKHWRPDEEIARSRFDAGKRLRSLDEFVAPKFDSLMDPVRRQPLSDGAKAGLVLVAAACLGAAIGIYQAFGPLQVIAPGAESRLSAGPAGTTVQNVQSEAVHAVRPQ